MSSFRSIIIYVSVLCIITYASAENICGQPYKVPDWEFTDESPAYVSIDLVPESEDPPRNPAIEIGVENVAENISITLYADPFVTDEKDCLEAEFVYRRYPYLRKFHKSYTINVGDDESILYYFGNAFTGCYYIEIRNIEGKKWLWEPKFYNTNYHYYDTMLKCDKHSVRPESREISSEQNFYLKIPLTCLKVECLFYELDKESSNIRQDIHAGSIRPTQSCLLKYAGNNVEPHVECQMRDISLRLIAAKAIDKLEGWETLIRWVDLKRGGAYHFTSVRQYKDETCKMNTSDLKTWIPAIRLGVLDLGFTNQTNVPSEPVNQSNSVTATVLYILLGISVTAISVYWMSRYARIIISSRKRENNSFLLSPEIAQFHNKEKFNQIILIYAKDSPQFMKTMDAFRKRLHQACLLPVHDLYSIDDWNTIQKLGAAGWIHDLLRAGSKVVWIDTPRFRSILKDAKLDVDLEKQQFTANDFRDEALPYAVTLATDLFQHVTSQYRCHFIVRLAGFEVEDETDDPLRAVCPHARYSYPEHFSLLCENLAR